jgi:hypothetical protein
MTSAERRTYAGLLGIGGAYGFAGLLDATWWREAGQNPLLLAAAFALGLSLSIAGGWFLWRNRPIGYLLSIWAFALQVPYFEVPGFSYWFYTAGRALVYLSSDGDVGMTFDWGSAATFRMFLDAERTIVGINIFALLVCYRLYRAVDNPDGPSAAPRRGMA